jgi:hypothetical protein
METILLEFDGKCRGIQYTYVLYGNRDELILRSYNTRQENIDTVTWNNNAYNLDLILKACEEIKGRL